MTHETKAQPVDVLAVLDRMVASVGARNDRNRDADLANAHEARAAVAELIEACKQRDLTEGNCIRIDIYFGVNSPQARRAHTELTGANLRYYAALARVGGAA